MAGAATGITLAAIASRENISEEEAKELMDELVSEGVLKKEKRNGETVYLAASTVEVSTQAKPTGPAPTATSVKFCRQCGAKIPSESKFCEKCGAQL